MARFCGNIGFGQTVESAPGIWTEQVTERLYYGDITKFYFNNSSRQDSTNDDVELHNVISVIGDPYAFSSFSYIKYVECFGVKWKVKSVDITYPRLIIHLGGVYNG